MNLSGGGKAFEALQHGLGKQTTRERIESLVDPGSFEEMGSLVTDTRPPFDGKKRPSPSDGVIMGLGRMGGRTVALYSLDFSVMSGSLGDQGAWKLVDLTKMAGQNGLPAHRDNRFRGRTAQHEKRRFRFQRTRPASEKYVSLLGNHSEDHPSSGPVYRAAFHPASPDRFRDHESEYGLFVARRGQAFRAGRIGCISHGKERSVRYPGLQ